MTRSVSDLGRAKVQNPQWLYDVLGDSGLALYNVLTAMHQFYSDNINGRWSGSFNLANSAVQTITHNLGHAVTELRIVVFIAGVRQTEAQITSQFTVTQTSTDVYTLTNISGGTLSTIQVYTQAGVPKVRDADHDAASTVMLRTATENVSNKTITASKVGGGLATATNKLVISHETTANIAALAREQGSIYYDTTLGAFVYDTGAAIVAAGGDAVKANNETISGLWTFSAQVRISDGTAAEPGIDFTNDDDTTGTGIYRVGANSLGFAANGINIGQYSSAGAWTLGPATGLNGSHVIQAQSTSSYAIMIKNVNSTNGQSSGLLMQAGAGSGDYCQAWYDYNLGNQLGGVQGNGVWTLGTASAGATIEHSINGHLHVGTSAASVVPNSTNYRMIGNKKSSLVYTDASSTVIAEHMAGVYTTDASTYLRTVLNNAGGKIVVKSVSADASNVFEFHTANLTGAADASVTLTSMMSITRAGAVTMGPASGAVTHTLQSGASVTVAILSGLGSAHDAILTLDCGATGSAAGVLDYKSNGTVKWRIATGASYAPTGLTADEFGFLRSGTTLMGKISTAGAWTFGPASGGVTHTFTSGGSTNITVTSAVNTDTLLTLNTTGTGKSAIQFNGGVGSIKNSAGTDIAAFTNTGGAWTFGASTGSLAAHKFQSNGKTSLEISNIVSGNSLIFAEGSTSSSAGVTDAHKIIASGAIPLVISHNQSQPIVFGTNDTEVGRVSGTGLWTFNIGATIKGRTPTSSSDGTASGYTGLIGEFVEDTTHQPATGTHTANVYKVAGQISLKKGSYVVWGAGLFSLGTAAATFVWTIAVGGTSDVNDGTVGTIFGRDISNNQDATSGAFNFPTTQLQTHIHISVDDTLVKFMMKCNQSNQSYFGYIAARRYA